MDLTSHYFCHWAYEFPRIANFNSKHRRRFLGKTKSHQVYGSLLGNQNGGLRATSTTIISFLKLATRCKLSPYFIAFRARSEAWQHKLKQCTYACSKAKKNQSLIQHLTLIYRSKFWCGSAYVPSVISYRLELFKPLRCKFSRNLNK